MPIADPCFILSRPAVQTAPLVVASAHSGRNYPVDFIAASRLSPRALRRSEDGFVDELYAAAPSCGVPLLAATFPRAYCDANREPWELDPEMFEDALPSWVNTTSPRVGAGLGTLARVVSSGEAIYRRRLRFAEAQARVRDCWEPYHAALRGLIEATRERHGVCLLLDVHSMPGASRAGVSAALAGFGAARAGALPVGAAVSLEPGGRVCRDGRASPGGGQDGPDFVLGDAHGTACGAAAARLLETLLMDAGYSVSRNDPYAGGYVTRHYGRPREGVHVLQVEVARGLYMDETAIEKRAGFAVLRARLSDVLAALSGTLARSGLPL